MKGEEGNFIAVVSVLITDNNAEGDGGKISFEGAEIMSVEKVDWEENCENRNNFQFECIFYNKTSLQWFDFVFDDQDMFKITVGFSREGVLILEETGGMECGAYFQTAQNGPYLGYPGRSGRLPCSAQKTFVGKEKVSDLGGFPVLVELGNKIFKPGIEA